MSEASRPKGPPKTILLATDLSARCDRALDRAVSLSRQWGAKLLVLHVLERGVEPDRIAPSWRRPPDLLKAAKKQLWADIGSAAETVDILIEEGDPVEAIGRTAESKGCDLVVTGIARDELFGRFVLGTTVDRLLRYSRVPILIVKSRAQQPYGHIAAAIDFSESSRHALETVIRFFPDQSLTIFHAYDPPLSGLTSDLAAYRRQFQASAEQDYRNFLKSMASGETIKQRSRSFIEFGTPADVVHEGVRDMNIDLVVLGTEGRGAVVEALFGSVAKAITAELPCDALVVREPQTIAS
ncbi:MAG: universal stress protein [Thermomicrobiales bacterium]